MAGNHAAMIEPDQRPARQGGTGGPEMPKKTEAATGGETTMPDGDVDLEQLLRLAREKTVAGRAALVSSLTDLFCGSHDTLSNQERALMGEILRHLVHEVEMSVRQALAARLADRSDATRDLIVALANDAIEVAHPILLASPLLRNAELIEIVRHRTLEHRLSVAMRERVGEDVSAALIEAGEEEVVATLLGNAGARFSDETYARLVEESRTTPAYREPLVHRDDLNPALAKRMYWWVSAALRHHILEHHQIDPATLDDSIEAAVGALVPDGAETEPRASESARRSPNAPKEDEITPRHLVQLLREGRVSLFEMLFARRCRLRPRLIRRFLYEPGGEALAIACRAVAIDKPVFASIFLLSRQARPGDKQVDPEELAAVLGLFERIDGAAAGRMLRRWQRDPDYLNAIRMLEDGRLLEDGAAEGCENPA
ncbi:MAG: DUF2336 domain-containing protein [Rhodospirillaceae bacterium]|jgi:uncharacterized protein (DUF2336 family)|nr:DUF2336 domain-containing protein [Rhodospirillaceae bacterium]MBT6117276.1 DUF2336 domain-containing protein [Rhodospirillaceae bacterium]